MFSQIDENARTTVAASNSRRVARIGPFLGGFRIRRNVESQLERDRKLRIAAAISPQCVSRAKWPVSKKLTTAFGMSHLNALAPAGRKNGSFLPQAARNGGWCLRK